ECGYAVQQWELRCKSSRLDIRDSHPRTSCGARLDASAISNQSDECIGWRNHSFAVAFESEMSLSVESLGNNKLVVVASHRFLWWRSCFRAEDSLVIPPSRVYKSWRPTSSFEFF